MAVEMEAFKNRNEAGMIDRISYQLLYLMIFINGITVVGQALATKHAISGFIREGNILDYMMVIGKIPYYYYKVPLAISLFYIALALMLVTGCNNHVELAIKLLFEVLLVGAISSLIGFSYTGLVFLLMADTMRCSVNWNKRLVYIILISLFDIAMNSVFIRKMFMVTSVSETWSYYRSDIASALESGVNAISLINTFLFIMFMVFLTLEQMSEKERIRVLNVRLENTNNQLTEANSQLEDANRKLEEYAKESVKVAQTRERNRLAREIHDTLGHSLTGMVTGIEASIILMDIAPDAAKEQLKAIEEVGRQGITDVRQSVKALRPDMLEKMDLDDAIVKMLDEMKKSTGISIGYICQADLKHLNQDEEDVIYRIVQESTTNSIRHGKATKIQIEITREKQFLKVKVRDNGIGCGDVTKGFGLHHMEERLHLLGGDLHYEGGHGFLLETWFPVRWGNEVVERGEHD
ncbi:MAG: sensor histidine kinase [Lachnospiraceae bacterium]|nr:sensor histidine kinase [Lachnospiraceae bacterium]